jgi:lysyl-tRNA synthetase class 2
MVQAIRSFFIAHGYLEAETPLLIPAPPPELHLDAFSTHDLYLQTSPELCMKRLLAAGYSRIFQISKCFRDGERGDVHLPECTLLEWYRTGIDYKALMDECEALILWVSKHIGVGERINYKGAEIDLRPPWERITVNKAFDSHASLTLQVALEQKCFDELMVKEIEPHLGVARPTFLYDYPASLAALARLKPDNLEYAERFEVYLGGLELANGFSELIDTQEQKARFQRDRRHRQRLGKRVYPMPEKFLRSLEHMPEAAGIALGIDRLSMIFTDSHKIDQVVSFTPEEL